MLPDLIIGCHLICKLDLEHNFKDKTPVILWDDVAVSMVLPCGHWTLSHIDKTFATANKLLSTLQCVKNNFDDKSLSELAADYHAMLINDMILTHLNQAQCHALWHVLKKHSLLFSRKLGKLPTSK